MARCARCGSGGLFRKMNAYGLCDSCESARAWDEQYTRNNPAPEFEYLKFKVVGVTFKNGRKHRQTILRKIKFRDPPYDRGTIDLGLSQYEYDGKPAFAITANDAQIGNAPAELCEYLDSNFPHIVGFTSIDVYGGGADRYYGAEVTLKMKGRT